MWKNRATLELGCRLALLRQAAWHLLLGPLAEATHHEDGAIKLQAHWDLRINLYVHSDGRGPLGPFVLCRRRAAHEQENTSYQHEQKCSPSAIEHGVIPCVRF